jgi:transcriptional antiterminator NusG
MTSEERGWYLADTYSGYENKVKKNLEYRIGMLGMRERIFRVEVPPSPRRVLPGHGVEIQFSGFVLVQMLANDHASRVVRNTPGVTSPHKLDL